MDNKPTICVFCGSSPGSDPAYARDAARFGALLAEHGYNLLFGGGYVGLMGEVAHAARRGGANVTGILPDFLRHLEPPSHDAQRIVITPDLQERKRLMLSLSDGFAVLPGGLGTLDEFFEVITSVQLKVYDKPVVLVDTHAIFAPLDALISHMVAKGFVGAAVDTFYRASRRPSRRSVSSQGVWAARRARRRVTWLSSATRTSAPHTKAKVMPSVRVKASPSNPVATSSVIEGERYCRKPSVVMRMRRAPAANRTSGTSVTSPPPISSRSRAGWAGVNAPVPLSARKPRTAAAGRNSSRVSTVNPSSESTAVRLRT